MKHLTVFILLLSCSSLFSQGEAAHWYFGNGAGLIFDTNTDTVSPTSAASSTINTNEGCSSISDSNGNLLFYTDGRNVWDKNHQIMSNADYNNGNGLLGDPSSTSSGLIIPRPGNPDNYYVFTVDEPHHNNAWAYPNQGPADVNGNTISEYDDIMGSSVPNNDDGFNNGLNYSLVDLTLNGGNGDVVSTEKNRPLLTYDPLDPEQASFKCSEKITAVEHNDGQSYWVLSHFMDVFYAFRVDANGVNSTPVTTQINPLITLNGYRRNSIGYLKSSPDGTKLAICHNEEGTTQGQSANSTGSFWIYDFDDATGIVSNPVNLGSNSGFYGAAFSTDSSKLYTSAGSSVFQFDLSATDVAGSQTAVQQGSDSIFALQLAPNGKIYGSVYSNSSFLDVINNPDELGALCNYVGGGQPLSPGTQARLGLPPFIQSFFLAKIEADNLCFGSATQFSIDSNENFDSIQWDFGDSSAMNTIDSPTHVYANTGMYTVSATLTLGTELNTFSKTIEIFEVPTAFSPNDILKCDDDNDGVIAINLSQTVDSEILNGQIPLNYTIKYYESQVNADMDADALVMPYQNTSNPQTLFARIENNSNQECFDTTSFLLTVFDTPTANAVANNEVCDDFVDGDGSNGQKITNLQIFDTDVLGSQDPLKFRVSYYQSQTEADTKTNPHPNLYYNVTPITEEVFVRIETILNQSCFDTASFNLVINPLPEVMDLNLSQCDEDGIYDGLTLFNLTEINATIINNVPDRAIKFYTSLTAAQNSVDEIDGTAFSNTSNPQTVYVQLIDTNTNCFDISELTLTVNVTTGTDTTLESCDSDGTEDGFFNFTLTDADAAVLAGLPVTYTLSYYETYQEALLETNPLTANYTNTTPYNQTLFARIENDNNCYGINQVELVVFELPDIVIEEERIYCLNTFPAIITLDGGILNGFPNSLF
jgi:PKD repeat protein